MGDETLTELIEQIESKFGIRITLDDDTAAAFDERRRRRVHSKKVRTAVEGIAM